jgi:hypothetical protein
MFPVQGIGSMKRRDTTTLTVAPDGQSYWAWCRSDTEVCFGIAARDGEVVRSLYADLGPPRPPEQDSRWVRESDEQLPDWRDD